MRTGAGWHGYWLNPGDAGLPMDVQWHASEGLLRGPLRYPVPTRLTVAGLMNYVYERDYAILVRLKAPARRARRGADPRQRPLARLHRPDLRAGAGRAVARSYGRHGHPEPSAIRCLAPAASAADPDGRAFRSRPAARCASRSRCPASVAVDEPYVFPVTDGDVDYAGKQAFRRPAILLIAELRPRVRRRRRFDGVVAIRPERGLEFHAAAGAVPEGGTPLGQRSDARCCGRSSEQSPAASSSI